MRTRIRRFTSNPSPPALATLPVFRRVSQRRKQNCFWSVTPQLLKMFWRPFVFCPAEPATTFNPQPSTFNLGLIDQRPRRHGAAVRGFGPGEFQIRLRARREFESRRAGGPPCFRQTPPRLGECRRFSFAAGFQKPRLVPGRLARRLEFCGQRRRRPHGGNSNCARKWSKAKTRPSSTSAARRKSSRTGNNCPPTPTCG